MTERQIAGSRYKIFNSGDYREDIRRAADVGLRIPNTTDIMRGRVEAFLSDDEQLKADWLGKGFYTCDGFLVRGREDYGLVLNMPLNFMADPSNYIGEDLDLSKLDSAEVVQLDESNIQLISRRGHYDNLKAGRVHSEPVWDGLAREDHNLVEAFRGLAYSEVQKNNPTYTDTEAMGVFPRFKGDCDVDMEVGQLVPWAIGNSESGRSALVAGPTKNQGNLSYRRNMFDPSKFSVIGIEGNFPDVTPQTIRLVRSKTRPSHARKLGGTLRQYFTKV